MIKKVFKTIVVILCVVAIALHLIVQYFAQIADTGEKALINGWMVFMIFKCLLYLALIIFGLLKCRYGKFILYICYLSFIVIFILLDIVPCIKMPGFLETTLVLVFDFLLPLSHFLLFGINAGKIE